MKRGRVFTTIIATVLALLMVGCHKEIDIDYYTTDFPQQCECWFDSVTGGEVNIITSQQQFESIFSCCECEIPNIDFETSTVLIVYSWGGCISRHEVSCCKMNGEVSMNISLYEAECDAIYPWYTIVVINEKISKNEHVSLNINTVDL